jgi:HAD superfamily hydrolase (TIGR01549 family)
MMIKWVFFDIGSTLFNDDPAMAAVHRSILEQARRRGHDLTTAELFAERQRMLFEEGNFQPLTALIQRLFGAETPEVYAEYRRELHPQWSELHFPFPEVPRMIEVLRGDFRLGIIADQPPQAEALLRKHGLWECFEVHGLSALVGRAKPDRAFYRWALEQAGCSPEEAVMVGDRLDNDVRPAREVGMRAIRLRVPARHRGDWTPADETDRLYQEQLPLFFDTAPAPRCPEEVPDGEALIPADILQLLASWAEGC